MGAGSFAPKSRKDLAEDRDDLDDEEGGDRKRDADDDDRIGHRGFDLLLQPRGGFEEAGEPVENFREQTAGFTRFHHARCRGG